jgi:hypothetical protein
MGLDTSEAGRWRVVVAVLLGLSMLGALGACGGGGGDGSSGTSGPGEADDTAPAAPGEGAGGDQALAPCSEEHHLVVIDFAGTLTQGDQSDETYMWADWINGTAEPEVRPGAPEVTHAYRQRGYELLYSITVPPTITIEGMPPPLAVQGWLERNGFATGDGTSVLGYNGDSIEIPALAASITQELIRLADSGVRLDAAYTDNDYRVYAFTAGGIPEAQIYTLGPDAGLAGTTAIAGDDLVGHLDTVEALPPVCATG